MAIKNLQVTIGAGVTRIVGYNLFVKEAVFQNNAANDMRVGDSTTTASIGIKLYAASHGSASILPLGGDSFGQAINLGDFYVAGTQNDVLDVFYIQG